MRDAKASSTAWFKKQEDKVDAAGKKVKQRAADDAAKTKAALKSAQDKVEQKADALKAAIDKKAADAKAAKESAKAAAEKTKADAVKAAEKAKAEAQKAADKVRTREGGRDAEGRCGRCSLLFSFVRVTLTRTLVSHPLHLLLRLPRPPRRAPRACRPRATT